MAEIINPKVNVVGFGPKLELPNGQVIIPDEFVYGAAAVTYKDVGALDELFRLKTEEKDITKRMREALINSAGAGHASMATTPGLWVIFEGISSKFVDSIFTTARFGSSLMPSSRRVPIAKENIVISRAIYDHGQEAEDIYLKASEQNIAAYETLQERGVPKEEAAKIVQYGHRGGGFAFIPLETLIYFSREADNNTGCLPLEGIQIVRQMEDFVRANGMKVVYEARKAAPRAGCPNPNIFHDRSNLAHEVVSSNRRDVLSSPIILSEYSIASSERDNSIKELLEESDKLFAGSDFKGWEKLLRTLEGIVGDYNDSVRVVTAANSPWRVWGEVKRHRTLNQTAESVYHAIERAMIILQDKGNLSHAVSVPDSVGSNHENLDLWKKCFSDSIEAYYRLVDMGIGKSEAIAVIPRGLKLGIVKSYDLFNLSLGYMSLRLCKTAEKEMRETTEDERTLLHNSSVVPYSVKALLMPKCRYVGFCPERKSCGNVNKARADYNQETHERFKEERLGAIRSRLE